MFQSISAEVCAAAVGAIPKYVAGLDPTCTRLIRLLWKLLSILDSTDGEHGCKATFPNNLELKHS
jgi:hypothetical protein